MSEFEKNLIEGEDDSEEFEVEFAKSGNTSSRPRVSLNKVLDDDSEEEGQLTIDVYQTPSEIIVESAVAGVNPEDLDIDVTTDSVSIAGRRHRENKVDDEDYIYQECYWGKFSRSIILPQEVDPESSKVTFKNGILTIRLPKLNKKKSKKLKVKVE